MTTQFLPQDIEREEGVRTTAYPDPLSPRGKAAALPAAKRPHGWETLPGDPWTIGIGHTGPEVREGTVWTMEQVRAVTLKDIAKFEAGLDKKLPWWRTLSDERQDVMVQMAFQMGVDGVLKFSHTLACIRAGDFAGAKAGMLGSGWAHQTPNRVRRLAEQMLTGKRP